MPIVDLSGAAVDESVVTETANVFREHFSFDITGTDDDGNANSITDPATGDNEKHFLEPLYERAERLTNPAKEMVAGIESGIPLRHFIEDYSRS